MKPDVLERVMAVSIETEEIVLMTIYSRRLGTKLVSLYGKSKHFASQKLSRRLSTLLKLAAAKRRMHRNV